MQYSTLQEAYNINTFKPVASKKKSTSISQSNSQQLYSIENSSFASNKEKVDYSNYDNYSKNNDIVNDTVKKSNGGGSCAPIQAPTYTIPISGNCKKEMDVAINTYTDNNRRDNTINDNVEKYNNYTASDIAMTDNISNNNDSIRPFYDEDMEQYFDINNLKDEVNYKSNSDIKVNDYMPNYNKISYTNDNTNEYSNNNNKSTNGINLLNTNEYNLSEDEKMKALEALDYLKSIENKINNNDKKSSLDEIKSSEITGPGGFIVKKPEDKHIKNSDNIHKIYKDDSNTIHDAKLIESINENKKTQNIFNMLINIFIFVFVGVLIILLCDYIAELAIQIGSTKTANTLEPYIKYHILYMQTLANNNANMPNMSNMPNMPNMSNMSNMSNMPNNISIPSLSQSQQLPFLQQISNSLPSIKYMSNTSLTNSKSNNFM
jgi:hypothetical protein